MLTVETQILEDRQAKLTVTVGPERLQKEMQSAASRISRQARIPGFRPGKAPYHIVQRYFGDDVIFDEAIEPLGQAIYKEALDESGLEPYGPGTLDDISRDPLVLSFTVPLVPEVKLGDYRKVRVPFKVEKVSAKDIYHAIEHLRDDQATLEPVERPLTMGDVGLLNIVGTIIPESSEPSSPGTEGDSMAGKNREFLRRDEVRVLITKESTYPVPGFPDKVVGMTASEERRFDITLSRKDETIDEDVRGKTIRFAVVCKQVYQRELPNLDDEFAASLGDYANLKALREAVQKDLEAEAERHTRLDYIDRILEKLMDGVVTASYPPAVVEEQIDDMLEDFDASLRRQGMNLDDYININKTTKEQIREDFRTTAEEQIRRGLILGELSAAEQITVTDEEIEDELKTRLLAFGAQAQALESVLKSPESRRTVASRLLTDKTLDRLVLIARGEAPTLNTASAGEGKPGRPRSAKSGKSSGKAIKVARKAKE